MIDVFSSPLKAELTSNRSHRLIRRDGSAASPPSWLFLRRPSGSLAVFPSLARLKLDPVAVWRNRKQVGLSVALDSHSKRALTLSLSPKQNLGDGPPIGLAGKERGGFGVHLIQAGGQLMSFGMNLRLSGSGRSMVSAEGQSPQVRRSWFCSAAAVIRAIVCPHLIPELS